MREHYPLRMQTERQITRGMCLRLTHLSIRQVRLLADDRPAQVP
jgi:hypothetical protein